MLTSNWRSKFLDRNLEKGTDVLQKDIVLEDVTLKDTASFVSLEGYMSMIQNDSQTDKSDQESEPVYITETADIFADNILMQGNMHKKGRKGLQLWKQRFFVLRGNVLIYYKISDRVRQKKGEISVENAKAVVLESSYAHHFRVITQVGTKNEYYRDLAAPNFQEMSDWVIAINTASQASVIERTPFAVESMTKRRTTHILLIRHGQYVTLSNKEPDTEKILTAVGKQQAELTGKYLSNYLSERFVDERFPQMTIYHSDMTRAKETAQIIAQSFPGAEMRQNNLLREAWPCNPLPMKRGQNQDAEVASMFADTSRLRVAFRTFFQHLCPNDLRRCSVQIPQEKVERFSVTFDPQATSVRIGDRYGCRQYIHFELRLNVSFIPGAI